MRKLIGMVDFVCENTYKWELILNYANFLKQPLELGMFVPCDEDGNLIEHPRPIEGDLGNIIYKDLFYKYKQAKERVLFEGFQYCESQKNGIELNLQLFISPYTKDGRIYLTKKETNGYHSWFQLFTIEDLVQCDLTLTDSAIKKLGL